jgi:hypothetical protein
MYGRYVFESRHGAAPNAVLHLRTAWQDCTNCRSRHIPHMLRHACGYALANRGTTLGRRTPTPATTQGDPGLARSPFHPAHRALHRAIADAVQGLLALIVT